MKSITEMFEGPAHNLVWKNRCDEIIRDIYSNFLKNSVPHDRQETKDDFVKRIKSDKQFSERWGLKIVERELSLEERYNIWFINNYETGMERHFNPDRLPDFSDPYWESTPTKEITITYNNEIINYYG